MSHNTKALVHEVIPYMDVLTEFLDRTADQHDLLPIIRAAAQRGRAILDKYYSRTDDSIIYRIAMGSSSSHSSVALSIQLISRLLAVLHPAYKLDYFRRHNWPAAWIKVVEDLVREEWETYYKPDDLTSTSSTSQPRPGHRSAQNAAAASSSSLVSSQYMHAIQLAYSIISLLRQLALYSPPYMSAPAPRPTTPSRTT